MSTSFAVIVTCYNYRDYVVDAIESALAQTRAPKQVIVVDDGSTDGSTALLQERYSHDPRVTLLCGPNGGQLVAFQRGAAAADADVLCFLDADDLWQPGYLASLGEVYDARADVDFVYSDIVRFGGEDRRVGEGPTAIDLGYTALSTYALAHWYGGPTSALSLRTALTRTCIDLPAHLLPRWRLCADAALVYGASILGGRKVYLPTGEVRYRVHGTNGWWSNRSHVAAYRNRIRTRELVNHYGTVAGICMQSLESVKYEFRTKPAPTRSERRRYAGLAMMSPGTTWTRLERALGILWSRRKA